MRNIILTCLALAFASSILGVSVIRTAAKTNPNYKTIAATNITPTPFAIPTTVPVEYPLPYPGILPDNTFYSLKMIRDRLLLMVTFDSVKKAEMLALFADKRLGAGKALIEGGRIDLGLETLTKGEKYLEQAANEIEKAKKEGKDTSKIAERVMTASLKHQEVLTSLTSKVPDEARSVIDNNLRYPRQVYQLLSTEFKN